LRLAHGYDILALARTQSALETVATEVKGGGGACRIAAVDLMDPSAISRTLHGVEADVLVNNAGLGPTKPFLDLTAEEWHAMVDVNFNALYHVTRALLPSMIARKRGHVVVIGSIASRSAFVGGTCYAGTKHAALAFVECLNLEVREHGVKVSIVNPGGVATDFSARKDAGWMLRPEDVAEAVANVLATPANVLVHSVEVRALTPKK
jgi:short-subunit dehydrogenase